MVREEGVPFSGPLPYGTSRAAGKEVEDRGVPGDLGGPILLLAPLPGRRGESGGSISRALRFSRFFPGALVWRDGSMKGKKR